MKQVLKWHSDADGERWMRSIAPFLWLFIPCLTRIRASSQSALHFLLKCLGSDACIELSGFVWVSFTHAKVTVLTWALSSFERGRNKRHWGYNTTACSFERTAIFEMLLILTLISLLRFFFLKPFPLTTFLFFLEDGIQATCLFCSVILRILPGVPEPNERTMKAAAGLSLAIFSQLPALWAAGVSCLCSRSRNQSPLFEKEIPII